MLHLARYARDLDWVNNIIVRPKKDREMHLPRTVLLRLLWHICTSQRPIGAGQTDQHQPDNQAAHGAPCSLLSSPFAAASSSEPVRGPSDRLSSYCAPGLL